jgi:hypothetical protein
MPTYITLLRYAQHSEGQDPGRKCGDGYIDKGRIVAVQERGQPRPAGFDSVAVVEIRGTLFPVSRPVGEE